MLTADTPKIQRFPITPAVSTRPSAEKWAVLAGLRFLLASVVVAGHWQAGVAGVQPAFFRQLSDLGALSAVIAFFILSGYSIAASLDSDSRDGRQFYLRRVRRIYPVYIACFVPAAILAVLGMTDTAHGTLPLPDTTIPRLLMTGLGLSCVVVPPVCTYGQSWSLSCEILYYAVAPLLSRLKLVPTLSVVLVSAAIFLHWPGQLWWTSQPMIWLIAPGMFCLWLSGWLLYRHKSNVLLMFGTAAATLLLARCAGLALPVIVVTLLLVMLDGNYRIPAALRRVLNWLGDLSYPLYLSHIAVLVILTHFYGAWATSHEWLIFPILCTVAAAVLHGVDYPCRKHLQITK